MTGYPDWQIGANITRQDLEYLIQRWYHGPSRWIGIYATVPAGESKRIFRVTGRGIADWFLFYTTAATGSHETSYTIKSDGFTSHTFPRFWELSDFGFNKTTQTIQLLKYALDGFCVMQFIPQNGITFESFIEVWGENASTATQYQYAQIRYTLV